MRKNPQRNESSIWINGHKYISPTERQRTQESRNLDEFLRVRCKLYFDKK